MIFRNILTFQSLLFLFAVASVYSQERDAPTKRSSEILQTIQAAPTPDIKQSAFEAVIYEVDRAKDYAYLKDRVTVWTLAADIIWDIDPEKGRKLLRDSYSLTKDAVAVKTEDDNKYTLAFKNDNLQRKLKADILFIAYKRDVTLVKELIDSFEKEDAEKLDKTRNSPDLFGSSSFAKRQLAAFAAILAKTDHKKAVEYAIASLGHGVPFELNGVFRSLLDSNPLYARELFSAATNHFLSDNSLNLYDGLILSGYTNLTQISDSEQEIVRRLLAGAFLREQRVWQAIREQTLTNPNLPEVVLSTSQNLHRLYQIYYPERVGEVEVFIRQVSMTLGKPAEFADEKILDSKSTNNAEALLEQAEKENNEENKNALYLESALAFAKQTKFVKALSVSSNATDATKKEPVENYIRRLQAEHLIKANEFNEASKVIERIQDSELRAETTVIFAKQARKEKQNQTATQILIDTQKFLEKSFGSVQDARAYLWLASAYTTLDPVLGFDLMGSAIKRTNQAKDFNELISSPKLIHLGGKSNQAVFVGDSKGDFRAGFEFLAKQNLTQTILLAESFENRFLRGIAILAASSAVIEEALQKEKAVRPKSRTGQ